MRLVAHGIEVELPAGWDGRIHRRPGAEATLHAANFQLPDRDGDFASGATGGMPHAGIVFVLKEYQAGPRLVPGTGLFASSTLPLPIERQHFHPRCLQVGRPEQAGFQHFFTASGRPFCLYAVVKGLGAQAHTVAQARDQLGHLNQILSSLRLHPPG
jgi:hypothetical protein